MRLIIAGSQSFTFNLTQFSCHNTKSRRTAKWHTTEFMELYQKPQNYFAMFGLNQCEKT
jgi:hypothetical protein